MGRPSTFSEKRADEICRRIAGGESMRSICKDGKPERSTVHKWLNDFPEFADQYARACEMRADLLFEQIQDIADDGANDWMQANDPDNPGYRLNGENIQRSRLRVDTLKWRLARMSPRKYGDRVTQEVTGAGGGPVQTAVTVEFVKAASHG